jgi:hypothetical protein
MKNNVVEKELINFNVDVDLKNSFHSVCRLKGSNMTVVFNELVKKFVSEESEKVKEEIMKISEINKMLGGVKSKMKERKYDDNRINFFQS